MRRFATLLLGCSVSLAAATASADEIRPVEYPGRFVDRPLTLRGGGIRIDTRFQHLGVDPGRDSNSIGVGVGIGITDHFEIDVSHNREGSYDMYGWGGFIYDVGSNGGSFGDRTGDLYASARFGFIDTVDFGLALEGGVVVPLHNDADVRLVGALPLRARLGDRFNLDFAPEFQLAFVDDGTGDRDPQFDLNLPAAGVLQLADTFWLAVDSGVFWPDVDVDNLYMPLVFELGFTVKKGIAPILDIEGQGGFPLFFTPGGNDAIVTDLWMIRANLRFYIQL